MRHKSLLILVLFALSAMAAGAVSANPRVIRAEVNGMVCAFCAVGIEKRLKALDATREVYVNLGRKVVAVELKDGAAVPLDRIAHEIREAGYDVRSIAETPLTLKEIRANPR